MLGTADFDFPGVGCTLEYELVALIRVLILIVAGFCHDLSSRFSTSLSTVGSWLRLFAELKFDATFVNQPNE
ncbi:hypothetical protein Smp_165690 [Schistosoma mansoni]|uniref:Secreted protein n=1 Tax=Schistosoma mansoni TaxID=6183 RepID=G4VLY3_SCHMA|nr:hypothetical protein Smp_165690 [Schistosoma mansoni]|eukprot:XP_018653087.1 hypothetical protein Smp_165690 [Schistosoma mansoni]